MFPGKYNLGVIKRRAIWYFLDKNVSSLLMLSIRLAIIVGVFVLILK